MSGDALGRHQGDAKPDLEGQLGTVQDIPAFCNQLRANLDHLYGRFEMRASEYFGAKETYQKEVAHILHLVHSYENNPGHETDLVRANAQLQAKVRQGKIDIEGKKRIADVAFGNYQQSLGIIKDTYANKISQVVKIPEIEAAIEDAEQKVRHWAA